MEESGNVAVVRIDRPPANALDLDLLSEGHEVREQLAEDGPGAVVLTGRDRFFSAGMDLKAAPAMSTSDQRNTVGGINRLFAGWYSFPRPVVAAVNGHAVAGGLILALCADRRVGATEGKLGLTELRAGLPYPLAAVSVVRSERPPPAARDIGGAPQAPPARRPPARAWRRPRRPARGARARPARRVAPARRGAA